MALPCLQWKSRASDILTYGTGFEWFDDTPPPSRFVLPSSRDEILPDDPITTLQKWNDIQDEVEELAHTANLVFATRFPYASGFKPENTWGKRPECPHLREIFRKLNWAGYGVDLELVRQDIDQARCTRFLYHDIPKIYDVLKDPKNNSTEWEIFHSPNRLYSHFRRHDKENIKRRLVFPGIYTESKISEFVNSEPTNQLLSFRHTQYKFILRHKQTRKRVNRKPTPKPN